MATDAPVRPADRPSLPEEPMAFRPARAARGPAVLLRRLIGIREDVLDWVPEERTRYTWYGAIVVNTAVLGGASMALALVTFRDELPLGVVLLVALIWFWVVLALDSWLVSSTHGIPAKSPLRVLLPRLVLSVLLGLFIAEPLLFQIFDKEIRQEIAVGNEQKVADYRGMLARCNPSDGEDTTTRPECGGYQLKVAGSPATLQGQIDDNTARAKKLQTQVDQINKTLNAKMATEQRECARDRWIWWNGVADVSETCKRARADSSSYRTTSKIKKYESDLSSLNEKGRSLASRQNTADDIYQTALQGRIDGKTEQHAADLDDDGILTRAHALGAVAWSDWYAGFVALLLHALLLAVDAMPVLAKLMSGSTTYDRLLTRRFEAGGRFHADDLQVQHACAAMEHEVQRHRFNQETTDRMNRLEHQYRLGQAERAAQFRAELDARAARILREGGR
ncbi:DUF4407 domain-containing protein [Streptomyces sp. E11-3]|uniref:DUF4407 domain-containing protein n=1 Tax=Streptomyces sp. E11-3 TaxID=3110112 RepID=UPI0039804436